jgi:tetratricopeptide (TPR) repeat protein
MAGDGERLRAPDDISAARIDPDGGAIRIALAQKLKVNSTPAAERFFVDLLPESWSGVMPGLPKEVVEQLAERAREAERLLHRQRAEVQKPPPQIRVKVASEPTFTRYMFDLPETINVASARSEGKFTLTFDQPIIWDLGDALAALPPTLKTISSVGHGQATTVSFVLNGKPDVRTFREDNSFAVDVGHDGAKSAAKPAAAAPVLAIAPPNTVPVDDAHPIPPAAKTGLPPLIDTPAPGPAKPAPPARAAAKESKAAPPMAVPMLMPALVGREKEKSPAKPAATPPAATALPSKPAAVPPPAKLATRPPAKPAAAPPPAKLATRPPAKPAAAPPVKLAAMPPAQSAATPSPPPAEAKAAAPSTPAAKSTTPPPDPQATVVVGLYQSSEGLRLEFPFTLPTPAAAFMRAETLWMVFDTQARIDLTALNTHARDAIRSAVLARGEEGEAIVRVRLKRPQLVSMVADRPGWTVSVGDVVAAPPRPLGVARSVVGRDRANVVIPFEKPAAVHEIRDPEIGDRLIVVTALGPARGFLRRRGYVELNLLASSQGVVVQPIADDIAAALAPDKITFGRPGGLSLSTAEVGVETDVSASLPSTPFDTQIWGFDRKTDFEKRQTDLITAAAGAPPERQMRARLNLARFYLARGLSAEANGVLEVALADQSGVPDVTGSVLSAIADVMLNRPEDALKRLNQPLVANQLDAPIWRAMAYARQGKWAEARTGFKNLEASIAALPIELQRMVLMTALRSVVEVRDYDTASRLTNEFDSMGVPQTLAPQFAVLVGRLDEGLGRTADALINYRQAATSGNRLAAAQGRLHEVELRYALGELPRKDAISSLEMLTTVWRGDTTEVEGLRLLAHLYVEAGRYRDAFHVMRTALLAHPTSDLTRQIQDEASATFESLYLAPKGDALPPLEALALFYDYRELTPIGPRGDEMIRRLADRLVAVDLLDQAAELLQHQVDNRLQGAARAQVATRLALIYLMNHKPERAITTLRATRAAGLAGELRDERLLLEARALSDMGQHDLALELIDNVKGHAAVRLRADILWAAKRWREAAEQIELLYGDRWKQFPPLSANERFDILRAAVGYALSDETMSLQRFRDRYMPKMAEGPDRRAFEVVSAPIGTANGEFQDVARRVTGLSTLDAFLHDMRQMYPDKPAAEAAATPPSAQPPQTAPATKPAAATGPAAKLAPPAKPAPPTKPAPPDQPTGSIARDG